MRKLFTKYSELSQEFSENPKELYKAIQQLASGGYEGFESSFSQLLKDSKAKNSTYSDDYFVSTILDNAAEGILKIAPDGEILDINHAGKAILAIKNSNPAFGSLTDYAIDYDSLESLYTSYEEFLGKKSDKNFNVTIISEGNFLFCEIKIKKSDQYFVVFLSDISEKLQSEMALITTAKKLEDAEGELQLLSMVASKTSNLVVIMDSQFNVEWINDGFTYDFGYTLEEVGGRNPAEFLSGKKSDQNAIDELIRGKKEGIGVKAELVGYHKDGTEKWIRVALNPVQDKNKKITHFVAVGSDITKSKNDRIALIQAKEKAEEASRVKAQFLSVMSHEIRTPMNAVLGMSNLLMEEKLTNKQHEYLDTLKFSSDQLLNLINDILDFSKIEAGKIELEEIEFDLFSLINGIKESYSFKAADKGIQLKTNWGDSVPHHMVGDPTRLGQILNNLMGNAVKFTEKGLVELVCTKESEDWDFIYLKFEVKDTGIGISDKYKDSIFEQFTQSDARVNRKYGGTGLGLAITKQLVELQNGTLAVESVEEQGSSFMVWLKFGKVKAHVSMPLVGRKGNEKSLEGIKILLVEDNEINQFVAGKFLEKWNGSFDIAENGEIALNALDRKNYDLVLMDIQMPVKDGYETTRTIRKSNSIYSQIPIIALTAENVQEITSEVFKVGMSDIITKPFNPDELYSKIKKHLFYISKAI